MKFLVVARPKFQIPPEMVPMLSDAAKEWYSRYESKLESFGNFAGGGGYGVVEAEDEESLFRSLWGMPFIPFSEVTVDPIWPGTGGFDLFRDTGSRCSRRCSTAAISRRDPATAHIERGRCGPA